MFYYVFLFSTDNRNYFSLAIKNPPLRFNISLGGTEYQASLFLFGGPTFSVEVSSQSELHDIPLLADTLTHVFSALYDALGLAAGTPLTVKLEGFYRVGSAQFGQFTLALPGFEVSIREAGLIIDDWINLSVATPVLRAALRDLRLAMQAPIDAAAHSYRAVERIRHYFTTSPDRKQSWRALAEALNVQQAWLHSYTTYATAVRHGEIVELSAAERDQCIRQAATVLIRFSAYLKDGKTNLSHPKFPLLSAE